MITSKKTIYPNLVEEIKCITETTQVVHKKGCYTVALPNHILYDVDKHTSIIKHLKGMGFKQIKEQYDNFKDEVYLFFN